MNGPHPLVTLGALLLALLWPDPPPSHCACVRGVGHDRVNGEGVGWICQADDVARTDPL